MNIENQEHEFKEVIRPLYLLMKLSVKAYEKFMQNKIYLHALVVLSSNKKTYNHILANLAGIPESLQDDILQLLNHYDIWMEQFKEFEDLKKPSLSDSFIFYHIDQFSSFPKNSEQNIFNYYQQLNDSIKLLADE
jgi:hypothetical protein